MENIMCFLLWEEVLADSLMDFFIHQMSPGFKVETQIGRKPPLLLSLSSMNIIKKTFYNNVLVQTHTSMQASTCRRLQPSLVYQPFLEGSFNPLKIAPASTGKGFNPHTHC
jgi:hypothetical protein